MCSFLITAQYQSVQIAPQLIEMSPTSLPDVVKQPRSLSDNQNLGKMELCSLGTCLTPLIFVLDDSQAGSGGAAGRDFGVIFFCGRHIWEGARGRQGGREAYCWGLYTFAITGSVI